MNHLNIVSNNILIKAFQEDVEIQKYIYILLLLLLLLVLNIGMNV